MRNIQMELKYIRKDRASHILLHNEPIGNEQENVRQQNNYIEIDHSQSEEVGVTELMGVYSEVDVDGDLSVNGNDEIKKEN